MAQAQDSKHKIIVYGNNKEIKLVNKKNRETNEVKSIKISPKPATEIKVDTQIEVSQIITESLEKVITIFTEDNQGTGFIINNNGDILTNAHVVEGNIHITVIDHKSQPYEGRVIGYSTQYDVAVVRIPGLANQKALELDLQTYAPIGEKIIALGSPFGQTNTATWGTIAAVNRSFYIGERIYENIYQMTALLSPGSSGGPLLSVKTGKVIGINSARSLEDESIGFCIPIKDVSSLISDWVATPLLEKEITGLFYKENGEYHFKDENEKIDEGYFKGGDITKEPGVYYEIPETWYVEEEIGDNQTEIEKESIVEENESNKKEEKSIEEPAGEIRVSSPVSIN